MTDTQRELLLSKQTLSIGITEGGVPSSITPVPWESTAHAFNMRLPSVYLAPEDLRDEQIMSELRSRRVIGCYISLPLESYGFLAELTALEDISICGAENLTSLDFLSELVECRMLYLEGARLDSLDAIIELKKKQKGKIASLRCVGLYNCEVTDLSAFEADPCHFSEFLVWSSPTKDTQNRWQRILAQTKRFYQI